MIFCKCQCLCHPIVDCCEGLDHHSLNTASNDGQLTSVDIQPNHDAQEVEGTEEECDDPRDKRAEGVLPRRILKMHLVPIGRVRL